MEQPRARINEFLPDPRFLSIALLMAHELGDDTTERRLRDHVEAQFEPRFFGDDEDRFGYFFGWGETWPRGQQSALLMVPEIGRRGSWSRAFHGHSRATFDQPTVEGVDYPSMGLSLARNIPERRELHLRTYAATTAHAGRATAFRVTQLPDAGAVRVFRSGVDFPAWRVVDPTTIEIALDVGTHDLVVTTGPPASPGGHSSTATTGTGTTASTVTGTGAAAATGSLAAPSAAAVAAVSSCRCC